MSGKFRNENFVAKVLSSSGGCVVFVGAKQKLFRRIDLVFKIKLTLGIVIGAKGQLGSNFSNHIHLNALIKIKTPLTLLTFREIWVLGLIKIPCEGQLC